MGSMNWLAILAAALVATGAVRLSPRRRSFRDAGVAAMLMLGSATMLGHNFARIGTEVLGLKPWLYPMQSGGLALAFVIPALWVSHRELGVAPSETWRDSAGFLAAYLAMGGVFWIAG